jgi:hypothetical protein
MEWKPPDVKPHPNGRANWSDGQPEPLHQLREETIMPIRRSWAIAIEDAEYDARRAAEASPAPDVIPAPPEGDTVRAGLPTSSRVSHFTSTGLRK